MVVWWRGEIEGQERERQESDSLSFHGLTLGGPTGGEYGYFGHLVCPVK